MEPFSYTALPVRVIFGAGSRDKIAGEVRRLNCRRAVVLCTHGRRRLAEEVSDGLGDLSAGIVDRAVIHTPVEATMEALEQIRNSHADCTIAVGGGTAIGLGKAIALHADIPQIALPTTYAGSEMTPILGQTKDGVKTTLRDPKVMPVAVLYDVELTLGLPAGISAASGMNALAHAIEALYARENNPITTRHGLDAIEALAGALPAVVADPSALEPRVSAQYGGFLSGLVLGSVGMALHHKVCHAIGGAFNLSHAGTHAVILPHAAGFNALATGGALDPVTRLLGAASPGGGLFDLARKIGAPASLKELGMPEAGIERVADLTLANPYWNPRPFTRTDIVGLLAAAYNGERPA